VHCYRMLGSFQDAEDAVQETMLAAWQGTAGSAEETRLAAHLAVQDSHQPVPQRAPRGEPAPGQGVGTGLSSVRSRQTPRDEAIWLQPFPDALLEGAVACRPGGGTLRAGRGHLASLLTALSCCPPRQVAVLILRDVLGFRASEVAGMLEVTLESANSTLKRARASLQRRQQPARRPPAAAGRWLTRRGRDRGQVHPRVGVRRPRRAGGPADRRRLHRDAPVPFGYEGRDAVTLLRQPVRRGPQVRPRPGASQRPAGVRSLPARPGRHPPCDRLLLLTLAGGQIRAITRFEASVLPWFGLPRSLPGPAAIVIRLARGWRTDLPRPVLLLQAGNAVNLFGYGLILPFEIIYLHRSAASRRPPPVSCWPRSMGTATLVTPPTGALLDHVRPKLTLIAGNVAKRARLCRLCVRRPAVAGVRLRGRRRCRVGAARTANQTLLLTLVTPQQRTASFALSKVASNLGLGSGATVAGFIIASAQHLRSFQTLYLFDAITYAAFALVVLAMVPDRRAAAAHASAVGGGSGRSPAIAGS